MNVADFRILLARIRLAMAGRDSLRTMQEDRATAKALADALIKKLALSAQEAAGRGYGSDLREPPARRCQERSAGIDMVPIGSEKDERKP
jgi:hypothetical protein